jgi:putative drug exporter of the RND superfamily
VNGLATPVTCGSRATRASTGITRARTEASVTLPAPPFSTIRIELGGRAIEEANRPSLGAATAIALVAALIVLLATFGSLVAAGLPLITALLGLGTALGVIGVLTKLIDVPDFSTQLAALLGLGVGIDYALFIVTRFRENHRSGHDLETAIERAMDTARNAVPRHAAVMITSA